MSTLSIDISGIFAQAFEVVQAFNSLIVAIAGISLGFAVINKIIAIFRRPV